LNRARWVARYASTDWLATLRAQAYGLAKLHERLHAVPRVLDDIVAWAPRAWLAKRHNGGAAKAEYRLFLAALKRLIERVRLNNSPDRQSSDLHKREAPEVPSLQNVYVALVAEENVLLVLQRVLIDCPETAPQPLMI
jgi:hypothetical protein